MVGSFPGRREERIHHLPGAVDRIMSGWACMGQTREQSEDTMVGLIESEGIAPVHD